MKSSQIPARQGYGSSLTERQLRVGRSKTLEEWAAAYAPELPDVRMLALPHHGADHNSDLRLQKLCPRATLVAHVKENVKKHPGPIVTGSAAPRLFRVTENVDSILRICALLR
ncbi:hypothetical protein AMJ96_CH03485 [Rhizobium sp. N113]|nr:hypothetical protein AMJ96_CH03485 [Rhizobium sp. N113]